MGVFANLSVRLHMCADCSIGSLDLFVGVHIAAALDGTGSGHEGEDGKELHRCFESVGMDRIGSNRL